MEIEENDDDTQDLKETRNNNGHDHAENLSSDCIARHVGIVNIGDGRPDLGVGRVFLEVTEVCTIQVQISKISTADFFHNMVYSQ